MSSHSGTRRQRSGTRRQRIGKISIEVFSSGVMVLVP